MLTPVQMDAFSTLLRATVEYNALLQAWMESSRGGRSEPMTEAQVMALSQANDLVSLALRKLDVNLSGVSAPVELRSVD